MARSGQAPSKAELQRIAAALAPGEQRAVGGGIYLRKDGRGRARFQLRIRTGGAGKANLGGTFDSWAEADAARRTLLDLKEGRGIRNAPQELARISFDEAAERWWKEHVQVRCQPLTQLYYGEVLGRDVIPFFKGRRIGSITRDDGIAFRDYLRREKTRALRDGRRVEAPSAVDRALAIAKRVLYFIEEQGGPPNALSTVTGVAGGRRTTSGGRAVSRAEILTPREVERIRLVIGGPWLEMLSNRAIVSLLAYLGLRPGEVMALRHSHWRTLDGPRSHVNVTTAVKDVAGYLVEGPPKNGAVRDANLWPTVAEELEEIYEVQGRPPLDTLLFPSRSGGFRRFDNWRDRTWYRALERAGIAAEAVPDTPGAHDPYVLRHSCATLMLYASKPQGGHYTVGQVARQLGHSTRMLVDTYEHVMDDDSEIAGKTVDEAIRQARRSLLGPLPGDLDAAERLLTLDAAAAQVGMSVKALQERVARGSVPSIRENGRRVVRDWDLRRLRRA
ncbi:MAG TPA: site-specific integrase [Gaiellaceae bacterium]|nr:site-specific integrase [Gaiellaceae bacterium]